MNEIVNKLLLTGDKFNLAFSDNSFSSFSTSTCSDLFEETFLIKFFSLSSKFVFFTKLAVSFLLAKFA